MHTTNVHKLTITTLLFGLFSLIAFPVFAVAATASPSCTLSVTAKYETVTFEGKHSVFVPEGQNIQITWSAKDADRVTNSRGVRRDLTGSISTLADSKKSFTYYAFSGTKKVACTATLIPFSASINEEGLSTKSHTPTLLGESEGSKTLELKVYKEGSTKVLHSAKIKAKNGEWKSVFKKKLGDGDYTVELLGDKNVLARTLVSETLTIGKESSVSKEVDTVIVVETIPLLNGGTAKAGTLIPFSYLQVLNIGKKPAVLTGFNVAQIGSASVSFLQSLSSVDDSGLINNKIEGVSGKSIFKGGKAFIPTKITLAPGAMHLFTLKTALVPNVSAAVGTQLKLQVTGVESTAKTIRGSFPIRPVTWMIAN